MKKSLAGQRIFVSHATADDAFVAELRKLLVRFGFEAWVDSRELAPGDRFSTEIIQAIDAATHLIIVFSSQAVKSEWVRKEYERASGRGDIRIIPLLIDGMPWQDLPAWFHEQRSSISIPKPSSGSYTPSDLQRVLTDLCRGFGIEPPNDTIGEKLSVPQVADLVVEFRNLKIDLTDGKSRAAAEAVISLSPAGEAVATLAGEPFEFVAPLGEIEAGELAWYLEAFPRWPSGVPLGRAKELQKQFPQWGKKLFGALQPGRAVLDAWRAIGDVTRRFSILVDQAQLPRNPDTPAEQDAKEAAVRLLSLPWELLHDETGYLFHGARGVRVRRRLTRNDRPEPRPAQPPIRVLLVSPRPEDEAASYIDHRISSRPVVEALARLGNFAEWKILQPGTFDALRTELQAAHAAGRPYHVVHFDGHGVYNRRTGIGALCFEDPRDVEKTEDRRSDIVPADKLAQVFRDHEVGLVFLEACQSAQAEDDPQGSVAGWLLECGVRSVAAMSHSVLVETARRFVDVFYQELVRGRRIGEAMLAGQQALHGDPNRGRSIGGQLQLQDWFVPILFQEQADPPLVTEVPDAQLAAILARGRQLALGEVPAEPPHTFVGRSRQLLAAERMLFGPASDRRYVLFLGEGGEGKTTLAAELARWLVATQRCDRAAFVSVEHLTDARAVLWSIGGQLVPGFESAAGVSAEQAELLVRRALQDDRVVIVLDNLESIVPPDRSYVRQNVDDCEKAPRSGERGYEESVLDAAFDPELLDAVLTLAAELEQVGETRLIFTSRVRLPEPFGLKRAVLPIDRLTRHEAIELVGRVLGEGKWRPEEDDPETTEQVERLVETVNCHARSLKLLAEEVGRGGLRAATEDIGHVMQRLHDRYPDDRERSLFASVELSLRRLPEDVRAKLGPLGLFHGGGHGYVIAEVLGLDYQNNEEVHLAEQLEAVGLADQVAYGHLQFHAALCPYLRRELDDAVAAERLVVWAEAMRQLTGHLYQQKTKDAHRAALLTLLELPNLTAALEQRWQWAQADDPSVPPVSLDEIINQATDLEALLANLGRRRALARAVAVREAASRLLDHPNAPWSHARFNAESAAIDRLLQSGNFPAALAAARRLVDQAAAVPDDAFPEATSDAAMAHVRLGRALQMGGESQAAIAPLDEAHTRFARLADDGNASAARMAAVSLTEKADCLMLLGQLDEAAALYEQTIEAAKSRNDPRSVATNTGQLGTVRMLQKRYPDALAHWREDRRIKEQLGEPAGVATAWHQIGMVHQEAKQYDDAERAYQQSLAIKVRERNCKGEASTLGQLGNLNALIGRREDAVRYYRQAADIFDKLGDLAKEGLTRSNIADELVALGRHDEARREIDRAIKCNRPFGLAAQPWKTFNILTDLERAVGNTAAAAQARRQAIAVYADYRRQRGQVTHGAGPQLCALVHQAITESQTDDVASQLEQFAADPESPDYLRALVPALQAILAGSRDPALADDPDIDYDDAVEIVLLLEQLTT